MDWRSGKPERQGGNKVIQALVFYLFAFVAVSSAIMVVSSRNPVHSVLFLILAFFNAAALFLLMGAEFIAMMLVIVYVGAVAVLFLFVVMMLDINFAELRQGFQAYLPIGLLIGVVLLIEVLVSIGAYSLGPEVVAGAGAPTPAPDTVSNTRAIGQLLYTRYVLLFQASGLILLVAMIGAIVLTLRQRGGVLRQSVAAQIGRRPGEVVDLVDVGKGEGV
ncbi:MAG: NADH-quinone oxidoreductase subunit J [Pseudomonadota bacterium]|nr:NADH-quinone oxidoreductase subunit J [Pseudomonadota bacterium]